MSFCASINTEDWPHSNGNAWLDPSFSQAQFRLVRYYSFKIKMQDLRGGFTGSKKPIDIDGVAHVIVIDEKKTPEDHVKAAITMFDDAIIVSQNISRPLTEAECSRLPRMVHDALTQGELHMEQIPYWVKDPPFGGALSI